MDITIDTSAIIALITIEQMNLAIRQAISDDSTLIAPESIHWEIGNAFSAMFRRHRITFEQALDALSIYESIPIRFIKVDLDQCLKIAKDLNIYAYDAYLIQCAQKYRTPLLTLDQKLAQLAGQAGVKIIEV
jgi:predicted nucleic acid-binding protein